MTMFATPMMMTATTAAISHLHGLPNTWVTPFQGFAYFLAQFIGLCQAPRMRGGGALSLSEGQAHPNLASA